MRKKLLLLIVLLAAINSNIGAQNMFSTVSFTAGTPMGEFKDYIDGNSFRGITVDQRFFLQENFSIGYSFGWQVFSQQKDGLFSAEGSDIRGTQIRNVNLFPFLVTGHYHFGEEDRLRPYVGLGLGAVPSLQRTDIGVFAIQENDWSFGVSPEIGVIIPFSADFGINLGLKYQVTKRGDDAIDYDYVGISLGIMWLDYL